MNKPLPDKVGGVTVERKNVLTEESILSRPRKAVLHTTEGSFESAMAVFAGANQPNVLFGRDKDKKLRIVEYGGIGKMGRALAHPAGTPETNRACVFQIEVAGFRQIGAEIKTAPNSKTMDDEFRKVLAAIWAEVAKLGGVPLVRGGNGTRSLARWTTKPGWFGHVETPFNDHTDPGGHEYPKTFALAQPADQFRLYLFDGEGKELDHSPRFKKGELDSMMRFTVGGKNFEDELRPELWDDGDVVLRLRKDT